MKLKSFIAACIFLLPSISNAQDTPPWGITCIEGSCTMSRAVVDNDTNKRIATLFVVAQKGTDDLVVGGVVPLGVAIKPGVKVIAGANEEIGEITVCFPDGCRAVVTTPISLVDIDTIELQYFPLNTDRPVAIPVPLGGLPEALTEAGAQLAKQ